MNAEQSLSAQQIIVAAQAMPLSDLEKLVDEVLSIRAIRRANDENELLKIIGQKVSQSELAEMRKLQHLRDNEQLSETDYAELARLIDNLEEWHVERIRALVQLADLRGITLEQALEQVGLKLPDYE